MAVRLKTTQSVHDACVAAAAERFDQDLDVCTNPDGEKNCSVQLADGTDAYPDIVVQRKGSDSIACLGEIETTGSVTEDERDGQWIPYAAVSGDLRLYVPKQSVKKAQGLLEDQSGIKLRSWTHESDGSFTFDDID